ncbi:MAG: dTDP-4-dehydrorhamnose 3,5-epimerase [Gammaproteobacteria bacterium]|jgi:dTDP-4-dehydrorhamnose 3,5-epimerase|nr:dTDP-4-dehydrorhamnose 3,5-epimerase [Gammaproteobacteria bacterium]MBP6480356.1 dTDP-4-dehydrorhamnose 3,5-epimerase [Pseudomonadales bacterium]MBP7909974.1 dTDP-4-dehydrorhamnose 3,5-epimerase [Pseudomonadales bacterium]
MQIITTPIPDVLVLEPRVFGDERGFFFESWNQREFARLGLPAHFVQDNHSKSARGILRGLHYQTQQVQGKLVRVVAGEVFDVAVDMRRGSPTLGRWAGALLSAANRRMMWIPPGFAHGFYVTADSAEFVYKCTDFYAPEHEVALRWDDPAIGIPWPLVDGQPPLLSAKDAAGLSFAEAPKL